MRIRQWIGTTLMVIVGAVASMAHHSVSVTHDMANLVPYTGVVTRVEWRNPHAILHLRMKDSASGNIIDQRVEMAGPVRLQSLGLDQSMLPAGEAVTIQVWLPLPQHAGNVIPSGRYLTVRDRTGLDVGDWWFQRTR